MIGVATCQSTRDDFGGGYTVPPRHCGVGTIGFQPGLHIALILSSRAKRKRVYIRRGLDIMPTDHGFSKNGRMRIKPLFRDISLIDKLNSAYNAAA